MQEGGGDSRLNPSLDIPILYATLWINVYPEYMNPMVIRSGTLPHMDRPVDVLRPCPPVVVVYICATTSRATLTLPVPQSDTCSTSMSQLLLWMVLHHHQHTHCSVSGPTFKHSLDTTCGFMEGRRNCQLWVFSLKELTPALHSQE